MLHNNNNRKKIQIFGKQWFKEINVQNNFIKHVHMLFTNKPVENMGTNWISQMFCSLIKNIKNSSNYLKYWVLSGFFPKLI